MTPEFKAAWVAALRSGKYEQGRGALRTGDTYCCLGVACDLIDPIAWDGRTWRDCAFDNIGLLPFIARGSAETLADLNDSGDTFAQIADFIEGSVDF